MFYWRKTGWEIATKELELVEEHSQRLKEVIMQYHRMLLFLFAALSLAGISCAASRSDCSIGITTLEYAFSKGKNAGCKGTIDTVSCLGKCNSEMELRIYDNRYATDNMQLTTAIACIARSI